MKHLAKRILSLFCIAFLLLTCVMTLVGCSNLLAFLEDDATKIAEYEDAFYTVYEKENASPLDECSVNMIYIKFGKGYYTDEYYCDGFIFFYNSDGDLTAYLTLKDLPLTYDEAMTFINSFPSGTFYYDASEDGEMLHRKVSYFVNQMDEKDKIRLYEVFIERYLQDYPDLLENQ